MATSKEQRKRIRARRLQVVRLHTRGERVVDIARALGVRPQNVCADLKAWEQEQIKASPVPVQAPQVPVFWGVSV